MRGKGGKNGETPLPVEVKRNTGKHTYDYKYIYMLAHTNPL